MLLRRLAAARYKVRCVAGIINIILKGATRAAARPQITYGRTGEGGGITYRRPVSIRCPGVTVISAPSGADRGCKSGRAPTRIAAFGDADTQDVVAVSAGLPRGDHPLSARPVRSAAEQRREPSTAAHGDARNIAAIYPDGFLPRIRKPNHSGTSAATAGVRGVLDDVIARWDLEAAAGAADYHFRHGFPLNTSWAWPPTSFDSGAALQPNPQRRCQRKMGPAPWPAAMSSVRSYRIVKARPLHAGGVTILYGVRASGFSPPYGVGGASELRYAWRHRYLSPKPG